MKIQKFYLTTLILLLLALPMYAQVFWEREYAFTGDATGDGIAETTDGYMVVGHRSTTNPTDNVILLKINHLGDSMWSKLITVPNCEPSGIIATNDGGFLVYGSAAGYGWVMRTDANGDSLWTFRHRSNLNARIDAATQLADSSFCLAGTDNFAGNPQNLCCDAVLWLLSSTGDSLITRSLFYGRGTEVVRAGPSTILVGYSEIYTSGPVGKISKMECNGFVVQPVWSHNVPTFTFVTTVLQTNSGYVIGATGAVDYEAIIGFHDTAGVMVSQTSYRSLRSKEEGKMIAPIANGGYYLTGYIRPQWPSNTYPAIVVMKLDANADSLSSRTFAETDFSSPAEIRPTTDGGAIVIGGKYLAPGSVRKVYVIKLDSSGSQFVGTEPQASEQKLRVFPNPVVDKVTIEIPKLSNSGKCNLLITNMMGQRQLMKDATGLQTMQIDVSALPTGLYYLSLKRANGELLAVEKLLISSHRE